MNGDHHFTIFITLICYKHFFFIVDDLPSFVTYILGCICFHFCNTSSVCFCEQAETALQALNCSGMILGAQPIRYGQVISLFSNIDLIHAFVYLHWFVKICRVSPSKTPVRPRVTRPGSLKAPWKAKSPIGMDEISNNVWIVPKCWWYFSLQ